MNSRYEKVEKARDIKLRSNKLMILDLKQKTKPNGDVSKHLDIGDVIFIERDLQGNSKGRATEVIICNVSKCMKFKLTVGMARRELDKFILMEHKRSRDK